MSIDLDKAEKMIGSWCRAIVIYSFGHHSIKWAYYVAQVFVCALRSLSIISKVAAIGSQVNFFSLQENNSRAAVAEIWLRDPFDGSILRHRIILDPRHDPVHPEPRQWGPSLRHRRLPLPDERFLKSLPPRASCRLLGPLLLMRLITQPAWPIELWWWWSSSLSWSECRWFISTYCNKK